MLLADQNRLTRIRWPYVTITLIAACTLIFLMEVGGTTMSEAMIFQPDLIRDQPGDPRGWVGLLGHALLHAGLFHLFGNMLALWVFGDNVEDAFGHLRFALFIALSAAAGAAAFGLTSGRGIVLVGASGIVSGIMAAYLLLYPRARVAMLLLTSLPVSAPASWFVGLWLAINLAHAAGLFGPGPREGNPVAWFAHLGGFAAGLAFTLLARPRDVALFGHGPAGDVQEGWLWRRVIDLGPPRDGGDPYSTWAIVKAAAFFLLAALGMLVVD